MKFNLWLIVILLSFSKLSAQTKFLSSDTASYFKLMFVGDVTLSKEVLDLSYSERKQQYDFQYLFHYIRPVLNLADLVIGNVENTYGAKTDFIKNDLNNAPQEFAVALKYAGFNLLMNANRTAIAQELDTWKQNRDFLESANITQIGSFENEEDRYKRNPTIIDKNGLKVAFLNYFYGIPYYPELSPLVNGFQEDVVTRDIVLAKNRGADYIIIYMNWGSEYEVDANPTQKKIGDFCIQAGANLVVGSHSHLVQEASVNKIKSGNSIQQTIIAYSLGDFISTTSAPLQNGACILELILKKSKTTGSTSIADLSYLPTYTAMYQDGDFLRYAIMPVSQVEKGNLSVPIDNTEKRWMSAAAEKVRYKFKGQIDEIEYELDDEIIDDVAEVLSITRRPLNEGKDFALEINNHLLLGLNDFMGENDEEAKKPIVYEGIVYKIQFLSLRREIPIDLDFYKHLKGYETYFQDEYYNYVIGNFRNLKQANDFCLDVKRNGHKYAYVVAFENGVPKK